MRKKSLTVLALVVLFGALGATNAVADSFVPVFTAPATGVTAYPGNGQVNLGLVFTANSNFEVVALGFYNLGGIQSESVGLYNSNGTILLASALVTNTDLVNNYFWASITPVGLISGQQYTVVAFAGDNAWGYGPAPTHGPEVTYNYNDYIYTGSLAFTTTQNGFGPAYYGPNIATTPEPVTLILFGTGLAGIGGIMRRRLIG